MMQMGMRRALACGVSRTFMRPYASLAPLAARRQFMLRAQWPQQAQRCFAGGLSPDAVEQRLAEFNDQFAEARLCLGDALESKDTTYFKDDILDAKEAVDKAVSLYKALLEDLSEEQRRQVDDANGLKVKSLQEEYDQLVMEDDH
mmetsp:Transcript_75898/g.180371  ORF Transcript_75898/g.180371 Transcript_75898/m.180371 type:complete len:145 (-) Transcript_75898:64-498(-)|eukprot:CAMPEP_0178426958 /NCGR_PEP_ID=MMETSP0689_2-20121128/29499_1 /TAXON_ID=160604 /ORGANISM="Amphidinium massartii, Strain CS-259" /LENGTH=144 /DNA_ID=CAMNT_0020048653 /DNA_START=40 /DNA_END=474 /DNA_ORIENTATION=+